jgi:hypothetical protein
MGQNMDSSLWFIVKAALEGGEAGRLGRFEVLYQVVC